MSAASYWNRQIAVCEVLANLRSFLDRNEYLRGSLVEQIEAVFQVVADRADSDTFAAFCFEFNYELGNNKTCHNSIILWLEQLLAMEEHPTLTKDDITAAQIFLGFYNTTWQAVGQFLIDALDSHNPNLRSCAAYQLGSFSNGLYCNLNWLSSPPSNYRYGKYLSSIVNYEEYLKRLEGIPPLAETIALIDAKEIEHPGLACAWMSACQVTTDERDTSNWMIDILGRSPTPETFTSYFPFTLGFLAHEWFSDDSVAIRRLIDGGRIDIACAAATDDNYKKEELEPLLIEIGNDEDTENVRIASWHLAYYYHYLHLRGVAAGYVEAIDDLPEIDMYLLFSRLQEEPESPYAVVIYPKEIDGKLSGETANRWVDKIFPESVRGAIRIEECGSCTSGYPHESGHISYRTGNTWYRSGFVDYRFPHRFENPTTKSVDIDPYESKSFVRAADSDWLDSVSIGYRSNVDWNPRQFL